MVALIVISGFLISLSIAGLFSDFIVPFVISRSFWLQEKTDNFYESLPMSHWDGKGEYREDESR